jgi:peptidyl-tRNA hydrolase
MGKGKVSGQVAHAAIGAASQIPNHAIETWINKHNQTKIILKVKDIHEFLKYQRRCEEVGLKTYVVVNTGESQIPVGTNTCMGVGPTEHTELIDSIFKDLKLL